MKMEKNESSKMKLPCFVESKCGAIIFIIERDINEKGEDRCHGVVIKGSESCCCIAGEVAKWSDHGFKEISVNIVVEKEEKKEIFPRLVEGCHGEIILVSSRMDSGALSGTCIGIQQNLLPKDFSVVFPAAIKALCFLSKASNILSNFFACSASITFIAFS